MLSYELAKLGYQAIDLGHLDIEYEWFRMGAKGRVPIKASLRMKWRQGIILRIVWILTIKTDNSRFSGK